MLYQPHGQLILVHALQWLILQSSRRCSPGSSGTPIRILKINYFFMHTVATMQRQALQDFKPRMAQMTEQSKQQHAAARAAAKDLHTEQLALQTGQGEAQELEEEKQSLQQLADTMQQSLASNSQVCLLHQTDARPVLSVIESFIQRRPACSWS